MGSILELEGTKDCPVSEAVSGSSWQCFIKSIAPRGMMQLCSEDRTMSSLCSRAEGPHVGAGLGVLPASVGCLGEVMRGTEQSGGKAVMPKSLRPATETLLPPVLKVEFKGARCFCGPVDRAGSL